jgi:hydroxypyruvate reductase
VAGDDLSVIGSGPCIPDGSSVADVTNLLQRANLFARLPAACRDYLTGVTRGQVPETPAKSHPAFAHITGRVIGNNRLALDGVASKAEDLRLATSIAPERLDGEAARAGEAIARALVAAASQGATNAVMGRRDHRTLASQRGDGDGRPPPVAAPARRCRTGRRRRRGGHRALRRRYGRCDGATDAAGAIADHTTWERRGEGGRDPVMRRRARVDTLMRARRHPPCRDTGTNVNDAAGRSDRPR